MTIDSSDNAGTSSDNSGAEPKVWQTPGFTVLPFKQTFGSKSISPDASVAAYYSTSTFPGGGGGTSTTTPKKS